MRSLGRFLPVQFVLALVAWVPSLWAQEEEIRLASTPALSPDANGLRFPGTATCGSPPAGAEPPGG